MAIWAQITISDVVFNVCITANEGQYSDADHVVPDWSKTDNHVASEFAFAEDELLHNVTLPHDLIDCCTCHTVPCTNNTHQYTADQYYGEVINCVKMCVDLTVPKKTLKNSQV